MVMTSNYCVEPQKILTGIMQTTSKNKLGKFEAMSMVELGKFWLLKGQPDMSLSYFNRVDDHIYFAVDFVKKREIFLFTLAAKVAQERFSDTLVDILNYTV